jgi:hypothetical protein
MVVVAMMIPCGADNPINNGFPDTYDDNDDDDNDDHKWYHFL